MSLQKAQTNPGDDLNYHGSQPHQYPPAYGSPPPVGGNVNPNNAGYFHPAPLPAAHYGHPNGFSPPLQHQGVPYPSPTPPGQHPGMYYGAPPPQPQQVFLGFHNSGSISKPMYGPPGATFDWLGNVYMLRADGTKNYIGPYRSYYGSSKTPEERAEDGWCFQLCGIK